MMYMGNFSSDDLCSQFGEPENEGEDRTMTRKLMADEQLARELALCIEHDGELYRQMTLPIIENLRRKKAKGIYDDSLALKAWYHLAVAGAKKFAKEAHWVGHWYTTFDVPTRKATAWYLAQAFEDEINEN